jgi:hypothetical protein
MHRVGRLSKHVRAPIRLYSTVSSDSNLNTDVVNGKVVVRDVDTRAIMTEEEVAKHYLEHHIPLMQVPIRKPGPPYTNVSVLENYEVFRTKAPKTNADKAAAYIMSKLRILTHAFFRDKYVHHAVVLETVAAVPGL